jgi:hypothetical protein
MSVQISLATFAPAATVTINPPAGPTTTAALPAVDADNTAMTITSTSGGTAFVQIGPVASMPAGAAVTGSIIVLPGATILLTAANQDTATYAAIDAPGGGTFTFTRGTVSVLNAFGTWDDEQHV